MKQRNVKKQMKRHKKIDVLGALWVLKSQLISALVKLKVTVINVSSYVAMTLMRGNTHEIIKIFCTIDY